MPAQAYPPRTASRPLSRLPGSRGRVVSLCTGERHVGLLLLMVCAIFGEALNESTVSVLPAGSCLLSRPPEFGSHRGGGGGGGANREPQSDTLDCRTPSAPAEFKFYLYEDLYLPSASRCKSGGSLLTLLRQKPAADPQHLGADVFLWQQLEAHPRRTLNPQEATLFVVPSLPSAAFQYRLPSNPRASACDVPRPRIASAIQSFIRDLRASPYYKRRQGRDHLMVAHGWPFKYLFGRNSPVPGFVHFRRQVISEFRFAFRNFIIGNFQAARVQDVGRLWRTTMPGQRRVVVPYLAPSARDSCRHSHATKRIECGAGRGWSSFEAYRAANAAHTLFFIGHTERKEELLVPDRWPADGDSASLGRLRPVVVDQIGDTTGPNILASSSHDTDAPQRPPCNFTSGPTTGCHSGLLRTADISRMMLASRFALHVRGDDASSSRFYEAISAGVPQIIIADRLFSDSAPFRCRVNYGRAFLWLSQERFREDPRGCIREAVDHVTTHPDRWQALWEAQRASAEDLLWHVPGSRVGANIIEEAMSLIHQERPKSARRRRRAGRVARARDTG